MFKILKKIRYYRASYSRKIDQNPLNPSEPEHPYLSTHSPDQEFENPQVPEDMVYPTSLKTDAETLNRAMMKNQERVGLLIQDHLQKFQNDLAQHVEESKKSIDSKHHPHIDEYHMNVNSALSSLMNACRGGFDVHKK